MTESARRYPVGIQTFSKLREGNYLYIDKSEYIYNLAHGDSQYLFLSRPRRFGKSLLTSTLQCYFEGRKELFEGLKMKELETEWTAHPVLHFDMSTAKHVDKEGLILELERKFLYYETLYGRGAGDININQRLQGLIERAFAQTGQKVVVLVDEYDAPLLDVVHEEETLPTLRQVMRNFYSPLKACDPYLRFVFFTGITKFSQLSVFSELNNITNISMLPDYAGICGITKEELAGEMADDIRLLAGKNGVSTDRMQDVLKENYDGYHFCWPSPDVFNPFSLLKAMSIGRIGAYWFESGTPTYIIEMLRKYDILPSEIGGEEVVDSDFNVPIEQASDYKALLYQSGYLTIKDYDFESTLYTLDFPNKEVRLGMMESLLRNYVAERKSMANTTIAKMAVAIRKGEMDAALRLLQTFLSTVPQCDNTNYEGHYQQMLYIIFSLLGNFMDVEVRTPKGRVDAVMRTRDHLYIIELKLDKTAGAAIAQIELKKYADRFALCGLPVVKVGINFSSDEKNITDWKIAFSNT